MHRIVIFVWTEAQILLLCASVHTTKLNYLKEIVIGPDEKIQKITKLWQSYLENHSTIWAYIKIGFIMDLDQNLSQNWADLGGLGNTKNLFTIWFGTSHFTIWFGIMFSKALFLGYLMQNQNQIFIENFSSYLF